MLKHRSMDKCYALVSSYSSVPRTIRKAHSSPQYGINVVERLRCSNADLMREVKGSISQQRVLKLTNPQPPFEVIKNAGNEIDE